jgi:hypothetical protein
VAATGAGAAAPSGAARFLAQRPGTGYDFCVKRRGATGSDDDIRLPRGRGLRLSFPEVLRIAMVAAMLVAVIALQRPCSDAVGRFVAGFDPPPATSLDAAPVAVPPGYVHLRTDMTPEEVRQAVDQARGSDGSPSAVPPSSAP